MTSFDAVHGRCAIVAVSDVDDDGSARRRERLAGRAALRQLLLELGCADAASAALDADDRGAPILPAGWVGSISHKGARAAALVARDAGARIGVDLERAAPPRLDIGSRVLTSRERVALADLAPDIYGRAVTLRFALKEAIYKAIDPYVRRYVGFAEVELDVGDDGTCVVTPLDPERIPLVIAASWRELDGHWLATASALRRAP